MNVITQRGWFHVLRRGEGAPLCSGLHREHRKRTDDDRNTMGIPQLKLVPAFEPALETSSDPIRRLFDHWVFMTGRSPARCKLGPQRRQAVAAALTLYTEADLQLAIEGNLVDPWCCANDRHDLDWLLVGESRIERFIELGERLRQGAADQQHQREQPNTEPAGDPVLAQAAREHLRAYVAEFRRRQGAH